MAVIDAAGAAAAGAVVTGPQPRGGEVGVASVRAFEDVYRSEYARMTRVAHLITGSNEHAEEVVQDAFVALYQRFDQVLDPSGYLYRAVVNGCRMRLRRRQMAERVRHLRPIGAVGVGPPELDETWSALARLSPRRRAVVVLRFYADLPLDDIAEVMGCATGTVKSQLHRALAQLKDMVPR
jgi:RNA polymerase sigma-70 factor (sigma-E family)